MNLNTNNNEIDEIKKILKNQYNINIKFNNDINDILYELNENNINISCKFHKRISYIIKEQVEFNNLFINDLNNIKKTIKNQEDKINELNNNIYYICIGMFFITILI